MVCVCVFIDRYHPKAQPIVFLDVCFSWNHHLRSVHELSLCFSYCGISCYISLYTCMIIYLYESHAYLNYLFSSAVC